MKESSKQLDQDPSATADPQAINTVGETPKLLRPWLDPSQFREYRVQLNYISGSFLGIACAGGVYPFISGSVFLIFQLFYIGGAVDLPFVLYLLLIYSVLGGFFGFIFGAIAGLFSISLVFVMNRSLGYPLDARSAAISAGSLAGYAPTAWLLFSPGMGRNFAQAAAIGFLGPALAMILGAMGAAWASAKFGGFDFSVASRRTKSKLSIMHLMIATTWIAVTFAIANFMGGLGFVIATASWFVLQGFMLGFIRMLRKLRNSQ